MLTLVIGAPRVLLTEPAGLFVRGYAPRVPSVYDTVSRACRQGRSDAIFAGSFSEYYKSFRQAVPPSPPSQPRASLPRAANPHGRMPKREGLCGGQVPAPRAVA